MKKISLILLLVNQLAIGQPLTDGMAILTHSNGGVWSPATWDAFCIFDTQNNFSAPLGANWSTSFHFPSDPIIHQQWKDMGEVFGIAIDSEKNVYFTSTRIAYDGAWNANSGDGGVGGVYKMNANDWSISTFINTGTGANEMPNSDPGLGNICYNKFHNQLYITNFEDGRIYRYDMDGNLLSTFDPFVSDDGSNGFVGYGEALFGININGSNESDVKLFFSRVVEDINNASIENNSIWYVELDNNGEFSGSENYCFSTTDYNSSGNTRPISDITFDAQGRMYLAEKGITTFVDDNYAPHNSRGFRYALDQNNDWIFDVDYLVGLGLDGNNTTGGVALGNKQTEDGFDCEKYIWFSADYMFGQATHYGATGIPIEGNNDMSNCLVVGVNQIPEAQYPNSKGYNGDIEIYLDAVIEPTFSISPNQTICEGESITLNVNGGLNYVWTPSNTLDNAQSSNPTATPIYSTTYSVTGDGYCGGTSSASVTINIDDVSVNLGPDQTICDGSINPIILDAGIANSFLWSTGETSPTIEIYNSGNYSVNVTSIYNCVASDDITISPITNLVNFTSIDRESCMPGFFELTDLSTASSGDNIISWEWSCYNQSSLEKNPSFILNNAGTYDVSLTIMTKEGCTNNLILEDYLTVFPNPLANFNIIPKEITRCNKTIEIINNSNNYTEINWNLDDGSIINQDTLNHYTFAEIGSYEVSLTLTSQEGCQESTSQSVVPASNGPLFISNAFTPNGDNINDIFYPIIQCAPNYEFWIYNRWGEELFYTTNIDEGWDGYFKGASVPLGKYIWKIKYDNSVTNYTKFGEVHLVN